MSPIADEQSVAAAWRRQFGPVAPAAFRCRVIHPERWVRIHSLPGSKRYPENAEERAEVVRRLLEVAAYALGVGEELHLFVALFGEPQDPRPPHPLVPGGHQLSAIDALTESLPGETLWFWFSSLRFTAGELAEIILARADDALGPTLFANLARGTAFAPYDGGADVFLTGPAEVADAKRRWATWLSSHPAGL